MDDAAGTPSDAGCCARSDRRNRPSFSIGHAQHPPPDGSQPYPLGGGVVHADVHELLEHPGVAQDRQRAVAGVDQVHRGLDDPPQRRVQGQPG